MSVLVLCQQSEEEGSPLALQQADCRVHCGLLGSHDKTQTSALKGDWDHQKAAIGLIGALATISLAAGAVESMVQSNGFFCDNACMTVFFRGLWGPHAATANTPIKGTDDGSWEKRNRTRASTAKL